MAWGTTQEVLGTHAWLRGIFICQRECSIAGTAPCKIQGILKENFINSYVLDSFYLSTNVNTPRPAATEKYCNNNWQHHVAINIWSGQVLDMERKREISASHMN